MKFGKFILAATAIAMTPVAANAQDVGATVMGNDDAAIGTVLSNDGTNVVIDTGTHQVPLPVTAFGTSDAGPTLNVTKTQLDEMMAAQLAQAAAALEAALVVGAPVITADNQPLGAVEEIDGENIIIAEGEEKVTLTKNLLALDANGTIMALATAADIEAAMAAQAGG